MTDGQAAADIIAAAKEARRNLGQIEQELQEEINEINFTAFSERRSLSDAEKDRRTARRATQLEIREAYVVLAYSTLKQLDESDEVARLQEKMDEINADLGADLEHLKTIGRYAQTAANVADQFAQIVAKAAELAARLP